MLLAWSLQPRPRTFHSVQLPYDQSLFLELGYIYSPDHRSLAVSFHGGMDHDSNILIVYDLTSAQHLFKEDAFLHQFVFDDHGTLLYLGGTVGKFASTPTHEKLMRWNPTTQQKDMIAELDASGPHYDFRVYDKVNETSHINCLSALSPDGHWWIVPRMKDNILWYERLDAHTGISAGKLNLSTMNHSPNFQQIISMCFTNEKNILLVESGVRPEANNQSELHWIDLSTGQTLQSVAVPNRVADFCVAQKDITVVQTHTTAPEEKPMLMAFHGPKRELQLIAQNEIDRRQANPPQYGKRKMPVPEAVMDTPMVDVKTLTAVIGWRYYSSLTERNLGNGPPDFTEWSPEYYYSVRDLKTGELLHTECLHLLSGKNDFDIKNNTLEAIKVLPGPVLVLSQSIVENDPVSFFEKSLSKLRSWLNLSSERYSNKIFFIDAKSGKVLNTLQNAQIGGSLTLSPDERTLSSSYYDWRGEEARIEYDYPLHNPWLLIWSWALVVAATITVLVEARRWFCRRKV